MSMQINGCAESENDFVKIKGNDNYIKTFPPQEESLSFLQEDAASNIGSESVLQLQEMVMILVFDIIIFVI